MQKTRYQGLVASIASSDEGVEMVTPTKMLPRANEDCLPQYMLVDLRYDIVLNKENVAWLRKVGLLSFARMPWDT